MICLTNWRTPSWSELCRRLLITLHPKWHRSWIFIQHTQTVLFGCDCLHISCGIVRSESENAIKKTVGFVQFNDRLTRTARVNGKHVERIRLVVPHSMGTLFFIYVMCLLTRGRMSWSMKANNSICFPDGMQMTVHSLCRTLREPTEKITPPSQQTPSSSTSSSQRAYVNMYECRCRRRRRRRRRAPFDEQQECSSASLFFAALFTYEPIRYYAVFVWVIFCVCVCCSLSIIHCLYAWQHQ